MKEPVLLIPWKAAPLSCPVGSHLALLGCSTREAFLGSCSAAVRCVSGDGELEALVWLCNGVCSFRSGSLIEKVGKALIISKKPLVEANQSLFCQALGAAHQENPRVLQVVPGSLHPWCHHCQCVSPQSSAQRCHRLLTQAPCTSFSDLRFCSLSKQHTI